MNPNPRPKKPASVPSVMVGSDGKLIQPWGPGGTPNDKWVPIVGEDIRDMRDPSEVGEQILNPLKESE